MTTRTCGWIFCLLATLALVGCDSEEPAPPPTAEPQESATPAHPADAIAFQGHWYKRFDAPDLSWHEKRDRCREMGGYLMCVESGEEQAFLAKLAGEDYLSLGATDEQEEGQWQWVNGSPWEFTAWMDGQPNNYGGEENYLATYYDGEWVDVTAEGDDYWMPTGFVCEWEE